MTNPSVKTDVEKTAAPSRTLVIKDYMDAVTGKGPQSYNWSDKPHRLVYDLCNEISRLRTVVDDMSDALKPIAEAAIDIPADASDRSDIWESPVAMSITVGNVRRAWAAYLTAKATQR